MKRLLSVSALRRKVTKRRLSASALRRKGTKRLLSASALRRSALQHSASGQRTTTPLPSLPSPSCPPTSRPGRTRRRHRFMLGSAVLHAVLSSGLACCSVLSPPSTLPATHHSITRRRCTAPFGRMQMVSAVIFRVRLSLCRYASNSSASVSPVCAMPPARLACVWLHHYQCLLSLIVAAGWHRKAASTAYGDVCSDRRPIDRSLEAYAVAVSRMAPGASCGCTVLMRAMSCAVVAVVVGGDVCRLHSDHTIRTPLPLSHLPRLCYVCVIVRCCVAPCVAPTALMHSPPRYVPSARRRQYTLSSLRSHAS